VGFFSEHSVDAILTDIQRNPLQLGNW